MASKEMEMMRFYAQQGKEAGVSFVPDTLEACVAMRKAFDEQSNMFPISDGVNLKQVSLRGVPVERISVDVPKEGAVILYIHGGAFAYGNLLSSRGYGSQLAQETGYPVYTVEYRLAPENPYPAGADDCFTVYTELTEEFPNKKIVVLGESAGATLSLVVAIRAKEDGVRLPACICAFSPCTNLAEEFPSHKDNVGSDCQIPGDINTQLKGIYLKAGDDPYDPHISPYYADYTDFPPMKIVCDANEVLADDSKMLAQKASADGAEVDFQAWPDTNHAFPISGRLVPESAAVLKDTVDFIERCISDEKQEV